MADLGERPRETIEMLADPRPYRITFVSSQALFAIILAVMAISATGCSPPAQQSAGAPARDAGSISQRASGTLKVAEAIEKYRPYLAQGKQQEVRVRGIVKSIPDADGTYPTILLKDPSSELSEILTIQAIFYKDEQEKVDNLVIGSTVVVSCSALSMGYYSMSLEYCRL